MTNNNINLHNYLSEYLVDGEMVKMRNSYMIQHNLTDDYTQYDDIALYAFDQGELVQTIYDDDVYNYTYPIILEDQTYPYTYLTFQQLLYAMEQQYAYEAYTPIQQKEIYESIQVDGNPNIYILKENSTPMTNSQQVTVTGYVDLWAYDKVHKGNKLTEEYTITTQPNFSADIQKELIKQDISRKTPWLEDLFWDDEEIPAYADNYYIGILITDSVSSVLQQYTLNNPRIVEKVDGDKTVSQLKGQTFRTALFNKHFEVYSDMNDYYIEVLQNCEQTTVGKCYEIVYNDLGITNIPEKQDINDLMNLIYDNQEKLNYYIYNPITNTIPAKARYNRQVYISEYYNHIFISQKNQNLFIKSDQLAKKIYNIQTKCTNVYDTDNYTIQDINNYITAHIQFIKTKQQCQQCYIIMNYRADDSEWDKIFKNIYDQYAANKIIPYYNNGKLYVYGTLFYRKREDTITNILSMFQRSDISVDYKFHEKLYSKGTYNNNYMRIDFNRCYSHSLDKDELPTIQRIKQVTKYSGQTVRSYNYYLIQNIQHPLIPCNILHGRNLLKLEKYLNVDLHQYIISEIEVEKHYNNVFSYKQFDKSQINIAIGCMFKSKTETRYKISPYDYVQLMNNVRYNYQFLHCQVINNKISLMLYALQEMNVQWNDILEIHTDAITIPINDTWNTLTYADDTQMFKQEEYNLRTCCLKRYDVQFPSKYRLNVQLIQAFAGSGKTYHIKQCLKQFRDNQNRCKDDKYLVLVCKNLNIEQYKEYRDVATIQSYQGIDFQNNYKQILNFQAIYLDEVYLMDAQFVQKLYSFLQSSEYQGKLVLVGDYYQQCNLNCKKSDYYFLSDIENIAYLKQNWRNNINYRQFIKDKQFDSQLMIQYCKDNNLLFDPKTITINDIDPNAVYICKTNETSCKICSMYNVKLFGDSPFFTPEQEQQAILINISTDKPSDSKKVEYKEYITRQGNPQQNIFDCSKKIIHSWYGNGITCYKSQGMQWKKIYIDNTITSSSQLYVAISRLVTQ